MFFLRISALLSVYFTASTGEMAAAILPGFLVLIATVKRENRAAPHKDERIQGNTYLSRIVITDSHNIRHDPFSYEKSHCQAYRYSIEGKTQPLSADDPFDLFSCGSYSFQQSIKTDVTYNRNLENIIDDQIAGKDD